MGSDAAFAAADERIVSRKKRGNRSAKLKQCKLDARREQWLSQAVKENNKSTEVTRQTSGTPVLILAAPQLPLPERQRNAPATGDQGEEDCEEHGEVHEMSDLDSPGHKQSNGRSLSSGSSTWSSLSISDDDNDDAANREENKVMDDWEAFADALSEESPDLQQNKRPAEPPLTPAAPYSPSQAPAALIPPPTSTIGLPIQNKPRAWRPDDKFRPQSLPSLSKTSSEHWVTAQQKGKCALPSSCPICYEDLDMTDSSFQPCSCGFRLCLFCHKRILEADGRCPGCRKQYGSVVRLF